MVDLSATTAEARQLMIYKPNKEDEDKDRSQIPVVREDGKIVSYVPLALSRRRALQVAVDMAVQRCP